MAKIGDPEWIAATESVETALNTLVVRIANWQSGTTSHGELLGHLAVAIAAFGTLIHIEQPDEIR